MLGHQRAAAENDPIPLGFDMGVAEIVADPVRVAGQDQAVIDGQFAAVKDFVFIIHPGFLKLIVAGHHIHQRPSLAFVGSHYVISIHIYIVRLDADLIGAVPVVIWGAGRGDTAVEDIDGAVTGQALAMVYLAVTGRLGERILFLITSGDDIDRRITGSDLGIDLTSLYVDI